MSRSTTRPATRSPLPRSQTSTSLSTEAQIDRCSHRCTGRRGSTASRVSASSSIPSCTASEASDDAVGYLLDMSRTRDDIDLIAVGPLTNVALAIRRDPGFATRLRSLTIMGGAANGLGNVTAAAEFNIWADPESAAIVFDATIAPTLIPLNLTHQVMADRETIAQLLRRGDRHVHARRRPAGSHDRHRRRRQRRAARSVRGLGSHPSRSSSACARVTSTSS